MLNLGCEREQLKRHPSHLCHPDISFTCYSNPKLKLKQFFIERERTRLFCINKHWIHSRGYVINPYDIIQYIIERKLKACWYGPVDFWIISVSSFLIDNFQLIEISVWNIVGKFIFMGNYDLKLSFWSWKLVSEGIFELFLFEVKSFQWTVQFYTYKVW